MLNITFLEAVDGTKKVYLLGQRVSLYVKYLLHRMPPLYSTSLQELIRNIHPLTTQVFRHVLAQDVVCRARGHSAV